MNAMLKYMQPYSLLINKQNCSQGLNTPLKFKFHRVAHCALIGFGFYRLQETCITTKSCIQWQQPVIMNLFYVFNDFFFPNLAVYLVAPAICRSTKFNWEKLSECIPQMNKLSAPWYKRKLFRTQPQEVVDSHSPQVEALHVSHRTRSRLQPRLSTEPPNVTWYTIFQLNTTLTITMA